MDSELLMMGDNSLVQGSLQPAVAEGEEDSNYGVDTDILNNLVILPPLQKTQEEAEDSSKTNDLEEAMHRGLLVMLPSLRAEEPVASIRAALAELVQYAHYTRYKLQLECPVTLPIVNSNTSNPHSSTTRFSSNLKQQQNRLNKSRPFGAATLDFPSIQYTSKQPLLAGFSAFSAQAATSATTSSAISLNDYSDLTPISDLLYRIHQQDSLSTATEDIQEKQKVVGLRIVFLRYDIASIRDHVARCKLLLDGNPPCVEKLMDEAASITISTAEKGMEIQKAKDLNPKPHALKISKAQEHAHEEKKNVVSADDDGTNDQDVNGDPSDEVIHHEHNGKEQGNKDSTSKKFKDPRLPLITIDEQFLVDGTNLIDFYNLACGEEEDLVQLYSTCKELAETLPNKDSRSLAKYLEEMAKLDAQCKVNWRIQFSGFHPPPPHRKMLGDLAYLEVLPPLSTLSVNSSNHFSDDEVGAAPANHTLHITATSSGFYVNKTSSYSQGKMLFDPSPSEIHCYSHSLLDCILLRSENFRKAWSRALQASRQRSDLMTLYASSDTPLQSLHRLAMRSSCHPLNFSNYHPNNNNIESVIVRPSWIIPMSPYYRHEFVDNDNLGASVNQNGHNHVNELSCTAYFDSLHPFNLDRSEEDVYNTFGVDLRSGSPRDWNEELQVAREMPSSTLQERIDRARMIHKTLTDFGEAALLGAKAIFEGSILPMNPNEHDRAHVYLHNNIFYSRAVDAGLDTFKVFSGDSAARKSASRDVSCTGAIHSMDMKGLHTLATVLVDYFGTRLVCQSIVPGILHGEKSHTLVYGTVETSSSLLSDSEMHELVEKSIGETFMIASRPVLVLPLSEQRMEAFASWKKSVTVPVSSQTKRNVYPEEKNDDKKNDMVIMCGPLEIKGIKGSDQRKYLLDVTRLTPRDANWVPLSDGGTGHWEAIFHASSEVDKRTSKKVQKYVPATLDDDEWTMAVLRRELIALYVQDKMAEWLKLKQERHPGVQLEKKRREDSKSHEVTDNSIHLEDDEHMKKHNTKVDSNVVKQVEEDDEKYFNSLRFNVNVFLPFTRSLKHIDTNAYSQYTLDEEHARQAAEFLWEKVLPLLTQEIRESSGNQVLPIDGTALTDLLHSHGINCRYLGRLAQLAIIEEEVDRQIEEKCRQGLETKLPRYTMPLCWLELLECEMVARASKHVLDSYFTRNVGLSEIQPALVVASFLSALMSTAEETAAETEARIRQKQRNLNGRLISWTSPNDEDLELLSIKYFSLSDDSVCLPSRGEIWDSIQAEIGRRYRYTLTLYNNAKNFKNRALYTPLLRRICQKSGIRLVARDFALGGKGVCGGGCKGLAATFPISPADVLDIIPTVKHAAALTSGFVPCTFTGGISSLSMQVLLPDAKNAFEAAQLLLNTRAYARSLEYAQEASALYQRVVDTPLHLSVFRCLELISAILSHTQEFEMAVSNGCHSLAVAVQLEGFDSSGAFSAHSSLAYIHSNHGNFPAAFKHIRAAIYLMQLLAGPRYAELANFYYRLGTLYSELVTMKLTDFGLIALRFYKLAMEASSKDRLFEGMVARSAAMIMALLGQLKAAVESEKRAFATYRNILGVDHQVTKVSDHYLQHYMRAAVEQGTRLAAESKQRQQEADAEIVAEKIQAEEEEKDKTKKKKKTGKKKKNK